MFDIKIQDYVTWKTIYRAYNGLMTGVSLYRYMNSPQEATFDEVSNIALYAYEALVPDNLHVVSMVANFAKVPQCMLRLNQTSLMSHFINVLDVFNHVGIGSARLASLMGQQLEEDIRNNEGKVLTMIYQMRQQKGEAADQASRIQDGIKQTLKNR